MQSKARLIFPLMLCILILFSILSVAWQFQTSQVSLVDRDALFQLAAFNTFSTGVYEGVMRYDELAKHGDFGIGTFDGLNGEMVALNGNYYQIPSSGIPQIVHANQKAPYATVTYFETDQSYRISNMNFTQLKTFIDDKLTEKEAIYAVKVTGTFDWIQTRSPQKQIEPYPNITEALKTQAVFWLNNLTASAVGFWFPKSMDGVDVAGYHIHLISQDRKSGGHLLDCVIIDATVEIDQMKRYELVLP